ncbi:MAG: cytochrome c [Alphaproteobacteria bacterium]|nr:cytochrome c [Alphaproteobacteria bacterium]
MLRRAARALALLALPAASAVAQPIGAPVRIETLLAGSPTVTVRVDDPVYKGPKHYQGHRLADVLRRAWPQVDRWAADGAELVMTSSDGYAPSMDLARALAHDGVIATRDLDRPEGDPWAPFLKGRETTTPAPFYLVWRGVDPADPHFRWPYKLVEISVEAFDRRYGDAAPPARATARVQNGFRLFVQSCISCHSVNLVGGNIGPELNVPRNVTEYWSAQHLAAFVKAPETYRARSKMPSFAQLPDADRAAILAYLQAMRGRKLCGEGSAC